MGGYRARWWPALLVVLLLAACAGRVTTAAPAGPAAPPAQTGTAEDLIGLWRVEATGEASGTVLRLGQDLSLWRRCGISWGGWAASADGLFIGGVSAYTPGCEGPKPTAAPKPDGPQPPPPPAWLLSATSWRLDGSARVLEDAAGHTVAQLLPGGKPYPNPNVIADLSAPPIVDADLRARLRPGRPLPANLTPAKVSDLLGNWYPQHLKATPPIRPFLRFAADGGWSGSDGCNGTGGRWALGTAGELLATFNGSTLVGCDGQNEVPQLSAARRLGLSGSVLVLVNAAGADVGHLVRS